MKYNYATKRHSWQILATLILAITLITSSCHNKLFDRTTTVYGTIVDQNLQPVDSIMVSLDGIKGFTYPTIKEVFTDELGNYEIVVDVSKQYHNVTLSIPFFPVENPKFVRNYKGYVIKINDVQTIDCCLAPVGEKTKYDFQLIPL